MCRNIRPLFNFDPPATDEEIRDAALQYVRKLSGFNAPSKVNENSFNHAIVKISEATKDLMSTLQTNAPHKNRDIELARAREKNQKRFGVATKNLK